MRIDELVYKMVSDDEKLIPVVAQDYVTRGILMLAYTNAEALKETMRTGLAHYYSRSRKKLWKKGQTSGNVQEVVEVMVDCDGDALLYLVKQKGAACHLGDRSCFNTRLQESNDINTNSNRKAVDQIIQAYAQSRVVERVWHGRGARRVYRYIVNPLTENIPPPDPFWSEWIARIIHSQTAYDIDKVVTAEALGLPIAQLVASIKGKPLAVVRKRNFHDNSRLLAKVRYASGFEHGTYWIYCVSEGDRVLLVDDAISTGGTLAPLITTLLDKGVIITDAFCVLEKPEYRGVSNVYRTTGVRVKTLFQVDTRSRRCAPTEYVLLGSR